jgi:hypothetical protein
MSVKIPNGYRLSEGTDVFEFVQRVRDVMNPLRDEAELNYLVAEATRDIDHADFRGERRPDMPLFHAAINFDNQQFEMKRSGKTLRHDFNPHRFELALGRDPKTGRVGVRLYTETRSMRDAFEAMTGVTEYHFQDSTEGPSDIPKDVWQERKHFWKRVSGDVPPIESMLTMDLRGEYNSTVIAGIMDGRDSLADRLVIPSKRERAKAMASIEFANEAVRRGRDVIKAFWAFRDDDGGAEVTDLVEAAMSDLTPDDFFGKPGVIRPSGLDAEALAVARVAVNEMCDRVISPEDCAKDFAEREAKAIRDAESKARYARIQRNKKRREAYAKKKATR